MDTPKNVRRNRRLKLLLPIGFAAFTSVTALYGQEGEGLTQRAKNAPISQHQIDMEEGFRLNPTLAIGAQAPDFNLSGIDGKKHTLADWKSSSVLAVMFICNHCPASQLYENRILKMVTEYKAKGVQFIAIQPNAVAALAPHELNFADVDDSLESMKIHAKFKQFNFPYLYDGDTQDIAHLFGPKNTPHIFIFDKERKLRYEGRIDDAMREDRVKVTDARSAIDQLVAGKAVGEFEVVTVSTDPPEAKAAVLKFLNQHHSAVRNYQFATDDVYALQEAFDRKWDSGVPFTMVVAPDGKVIYQEAGEISMLKMRRTVLSYLPDLGYIGNANYWAKSIGLTR